MDGNTVYYIRLAGSEDVYTVPVSLSDQLPFVAVGDRITLTVSSAGEFKKVLAVKFPELFELNQKERIAFRKVFSAEGGSFCLSVLFPEERTYPYSTNCKGGKEDGSANLAESLASVGPACLGCSFAGVCFA